jgi:hypothetical protein
MLTVSSHWCYSRECAEVFHLANIQFYGYDLRDLFRTSLRITLKHVFNAPYTCFKAQMYKGRCARVALRFLVSCTFYSKVKTMFHQNHTLTSGELN